MGDRAEQTKRLGIQREAHRRKEDTAVIDDIDRESDRGVLESDLSVFACFVTRWCHSCYPTCLLADGLAKDYAGRVKFVKVDVEENPEIAERFHVTAVPTIILFQNAQPVNRLLGFQHRGSLRSLLDSVTGENEMTGRRVPG